MYDIVLTKQAVKDAKLIERAGLKPRVVLLLRIMRENPYQNPPPYEKLKGQLSMFYSRRINARHRLVYAVDDERRVVKIAAMWTHYE